MYARLLAPLTATLLLLLGVFLLLEYHYGQDQRHSKLLNTVTTAEDLLAHHLKKDASMIDAAMTVIARDERLLAAFRAKDRQAMQAQMQPLFDQLRREHRITHFYVIESDHTTFLRVHQPEWHGDTVRRFTVLTAESTGKPAWGIELGPLGTLALRVVHPWYDGERLVGYLELDEEIDGVIEGLRETLGIQAYALVDKKYLDRTHWEIGMRMTGYEAQWDRFPDAVAIGKTPLPESFADMLARRRDDPERSNCDFRSGDRDCRAAFLPLVDGRGRTVGELAVVLDVTDQVAASRWSLFAAAIGCLGIGAALFMLFYVDLVRAKNAAEAASRAKSEFLAVMSHEIRTPIAAITGYADLLATSDVSPSERRQGLETIQSNADNLLMLIDDILDYSRIEAGRLPLTPADCSPQKIVDEVRSAVQLRANEKRLDFEVRYDGPVPQSIRTDPVRLRQILLNLAGNAVKFTDAGSVRVTVRCLRREDSPPRMQFEVADTGIGMTGEVVGRLFRPFTQADMSTTRRFGGTGLGLSISQRLSAMLGGEIEVESEPGKGSTFTLTIDPGPLEGVPMVDGPVPAARSTDFPPASEPAARKARLTGRVLLAEDGPDVQRLVRCFLEQCGLEVDVAPGGRVACEKADASAREGRPYDLVLMDVRMPEMDGHEATRRLRRNGWRGAIVALTAHAMPGDREECLCAGCDDYLAKPSRLSDLREMVERHLKRPAGDSAVAAPLESGIPGEFPFDIDADPELAELFRAFTADLPERAEQIRKALESRDFALVRHRAHQLKGAAAMYGFPAISRLAATIIRKVVEDAPADQFSATVQELTALCEHAAGRRRADAG
jgi:signal transduction histidine kinase/CheY-like chemotaxis protein/HPt (histidine-containing phosphotransfer) domain-containing protein